MTGPLTLTEPWGDLRAGEPLTVLEQCDDGTSLVRPRIASGEPAWVPTHLLTAHRPTDPFVPIRR